MKCPHLSLTFSEDALHHPGRVPKLSLAPPFAPQSCIHICSSCRDSRTLAPFWHPLWKWLYPPLDITNVATVEMLGTNGYLDPPIFFQLLHPCYLAIKYYANTSYIPMQTHHCPTAHQCGDPWPHWRLAVCCWRFVYLVQGFNKSRYFFFYFLFFGSSSSSSTADGWWTDIHGAEDFLSAHNLISRIWQPSSPPFISHFLFKHHIFSIQVVVFLGGAKRYVCPEVFRLGGAIAHFAPT